MFQEEDILKTLRSLHRVNDGMWFYDLKGMEQLHEFMAQQMDYGTRIGIRLRHRLHNDISEYHFAGRQSDHFYIPSRFRTEFVALCMALAPTKLHHEVIVPNILGMLSNSSDDVQVFEGYYQRLEFDAAKMGSTEWATAHHEKILLPSGLIDSAFALHSWKLADETAAKSFTNWWMELYSC
jgi:hypothetical protein